jgi:pimeloyl-ACP methyl ester carboxylesterase
VTEEVRASVFHLSFKPSNEDPRVSQQQRIYDVEFSKGGWTGPLNYYKAQVEPDGELEDAKSEFSLSLSLPSDSTLITSNKTTEIPFANYKINKPVFLGCTLKDEICLPALQKPITAQFCPQTTVHEFNTGHWVLNDVPDEVNEALDKWITESISGSA